MKVKCGIKVKGIYNPVAGKPATEDAPSSKPLPNLKVAKGKK